MDSSSMKFGRWPTRKRLLWSSLATAAGIIVLLSAFQNCGEKPAPDGGGGGVRYLSTPTPTPSGGDNEGDSTPTPTPSGSPSVTPTPTPEPCQLTGTWVSACDPTQKVIETFTFPNCEEFTWRQVIYSDSSCSTETLRITYEGDMVRMAHMPAGRGLDLYFSSEIRFMVTDPFLVELYNSNERCFSSNWRVGEERTHYSHECLLMEDEFPHDVFTHLYSVSGTTLTFGNTEHCVNGICQSRFGSRPSALDTSHLFTRR